MRRTFSFSRVFRKLQFTNRRRSLFWEGAEEGYVLPQEGYRTAALLRFTCEDKAAALTKALEVFGSLRQVELPKTPAEELAFVTPVLPEGEMMRLARSLPGAALTSMVRLADL